MTMNDDDVQGATCVHAPVMAKRERERGGGAQSNGHELATVCKWWPPLQSSDLPFPFPFCTNGRYQAMEKEGKGKTDKYFPQMINVFV